MCATTCRPTPLPLRPLLRVCPRSSISAGACHGTRPSRRLGVCPLPVPSSSASAPLCYPVPARAVAPSSCVAPVDHRRSGCLRRSTTRKPGLCCARPASLVAPAPLLLPVVVAFLPPRPAPPSLPTMACPLWCRAAACLGPMTSSSCASLAFLHHFVSAVRPQAILASRSSSAKDTKTFRGCVKYPAALRYRQERVPRRPVSLKNAKCRFVRRPNDYHTGTSSTWIR